MEKKMKILFVLRHIEGVERKLSVNGTNNFIENYNFFIFNIHCERMQLKKQNLNSILHSINAFIICITMFICIYMYIVYLLSYQEKNLSGYREVSPFVLYQRETLVANKDRGDLLLCPIFLLRRSNITENI